MENKRINENLKKLYEENTDQFLELWGKCFEVKKEDRPSSINEFGIIDPEKFDTEKRVLVIGKETRGWDFPLRKWLNYLSSPNADLNSENGTKHPKIWYNIGRWAKLIQNSDLEIKDLAKEKEEALLGLSYIAFTNINKVGGYSKSITSFWNLAKNSLVKKIIQKEIDIIKPKYIVLCGIDKEYLENTDKSIKIIKMPHPSAMKSTEKMLQELKEQLSK